MLRIFVSLEDPDTGIAIARTLQSGLRAPRIVGLRNRPTGPAVPRDLFHEIRTVSRPDDADTGGSPPSLASVLDDGDILIPSDPREAMTLAAVEPSTGTILVPPDSALDQTTGPHPEAATRLPVRAPAWISVDAPVEDVHAFGRTYNWNVCMRSVHGDGHALSHWSEFEELREMLVTRAGSDEDVFLQRTVVGIRYVLSFAANRGRMLDTVMIRDGQTPRLHELEEVPTSLRSELASVLSTLAWTGGGSIDMIEAHDGTLFLDRWRPCFGPAVEGIAACGLNLPARLVASITGESLVDSRLSSSAFVKVTRRIPAFGGDSHVRPARRDATEHGDPNSPPSRDTSVGGTTMTEALADVVSELPDHGSFDDTPRHVLLPNRTRRRFEAFVDAANRVESIYGLDEAHVGISIKTNPANPLLRTARQSGMLAETIHRDEMVHARNHGYSIDEMIVNGPVQTLLPDLSRAPFALFGDAIKDLDDLPFDVSESIVGVRTRPPERGPSRFGVDLSDLARMDRLCDTLSSLPPQTQIGLHFHAPSSTLGHDQWWSSLDRVLDWATTIQERTSRPLECLDLGGGWHPDDWLDVFIPGLLERKDEICQRLPDLSVLLLEPGKALSQPLGVVVSRVLDVRPSRSEVILDASIAELSNIEYHPHRLLAHTSDRGWHRLPRGGGRLLGRLCMEADILGRNRDVGHLSPGDTVVVCDAGAYDASMTYPFGRGRTAATGSPRNT